MGTRFEIKGLHNLTVTLLFTYNFFISVFFSFLNSSINLNNDWYYFFPELIGMGTNISKKDEVLIFSGCHNVLI